MTERRRSIFITGAASGIGKATAELFASHGWLVGVCDRDGGAAAAVAKASGGRDYCLDVTDRAALVDALDDFTGQTSGTLDCVFANAGIDAKGDFATMDWARIVAVIEVNLLGAMSLIHAALPHLKRTENALCLATASGSAIFGVGGIAAYSASKRGIRGLIEALSIELAPAGVRVADLLPGVVDTAMPGEAMKAMVPTQGKWRLIPASDVAEAAWAAYHGTALHHFVPAELADYDRRAVAEPEAVRDGWIAGRLP